ncbi:MAG: Holliday junction branch migration protein RuvA [Actinomycetia bacterium]|nr:Holliday junction branch migration protein RuvA [Actinomycetes bacterium]
MIASLSGAVAAVDPAGLVVVVSGVGFRVLLPPGAATGWHVGEEATLHTSLVVREDALTLYGFASPADRDCFELVQQASGIGPRIGLAVVAVLGPSGLAQAVRTENLTALTKVPGIGRKGAQKLVIELKDKVLDLGFAPPGPAGTAHPAPTGWREAVASGLQGLGWTAKDAEAACAAVEEQVESDPGMPVSAIMRAALASLARA